MTNIRTNRKEEMIDAAEKLFSEKSYMETSIDDICDEVGVAHSLFYYYFDSKDQIIEAIIERMISEIEKRLMEVVKITELTADEKFLKFMTLAFNRKKERPYLASFYSRENNPKVYYRLLNRMIEIVTPYMTKIVKQGIEEGIFDTEYPEQTIRFWLNGRMFMMDEEEPIRDGIFEDMKAEAFMLERLLRAKDSFLTNFYEQFEKDIKEFLDKARGDE
ncbi:MAG: TetR/AcrR family transcriptional regulator [Thermoplasmatota archaeon]